MVLRVPCLFSPLYSPIESNHSPASYTLSVYNYTTLSVNANNLINPRPVDQLAPPILSAPAFFNAAASLSLQLNFTRVVTCKSQII